MLIFSIGSVPTLPGFLRWLFCKDWQCATATIVKIHNLTKHHYFIWDYPFVIWNWRGVGSIAHYEAEIEYVADGEKYSSSMVLLTDDERLEKKHTIYFDPLNPSIFSRKKGLGYDGTGFLAVMAAVIALMLVDL